MLIQKIYLDNAATTALDPRVLEAMMPFFADNFGNPSSSHDAGRKARLEIEKARMEVAQILGAKRNEIIFTSGGTESNNIAIRSVIRDLKIKSIITSRTEHKSVLATVQELQNSGQAIVNYVNLRNDGTIDLFDLSRLLSENPRTLVSLMHANNETGNMINLDMVGGICKRHNAIFHSDTVQTVGHYPLNLSNVAVDLITGAGHKFHGPKGSGILYIREGLNLKSVTTGGVQEREMRPGTENTAAIVGFAEALKLANKTMSEDGVHIRQLKNTLIDILAKLKVHCNGNTTSKSLYTVVNAAFPKNEQTESLLMELDMAGICASGGSACSAGMGGSHVMEAMHADETNNIRFSMSKHNTMEEINQLGEILQHTLYGEHA